MLRIVLVGVLTLGIGELALAQTRFESPGAAAAKAIEENARRQAELDRIRAETARIQAETDAINKAKQSPPTPAPAPATEQTPPLPHEEMIQLLVKAVLDLRERVEQLERLALKQLK